MRLFFAIKRLASSPGGAERVICVVCSQLVSRGHEVFLITFDSPGGQPFYPLDPRVNRIDLNIGDSSRSAFLIESLKRMRALRQIVKAERPDIVVGFMHSMFVPIAFAIVGTGIPVIASEHIVLDHYRTRRFQYLLFIFASFFLDKITVLSEAIRARYPYSIKKRMVVMPNPVQFSVNPANLRIDKESFTILSVGRLESQKDHATLIRAFSKIAPKFPQWSLKILGEGSLRTDLNELVRTLNLNSKVSMPGVTTSINEEYMAADMCVISSRYEAFGLVTAEAMSFGLCVVGFADCPGTNELIESGKTGLLVLPGKDRAGSLASSLSRLLSDPSLRHKFGMAGREAIKNKLSLSQVCDHWENLLLTNIKLT